MNVNVIKLWKDGKVDTVEINTPIFFRSEAKLEGFKEGERLLRVRTASSDILALIPNNGWAIDINNDVFNTVNVTNWNWVFEPISEDDKKALEAYAKDKPYIDLPGMIYRISNKYITSFNTGEFWN